jgi:hypothetical protein
MRNENITEFLELSVVLTGHREFDLRGTGLVNEYLDALASAVGVGPLALLRGVPSAVRGGAECVVVTFAMTDRAPW